MKINQDQTDDFVEPITESEILPILRPKANAKFLGTRLGQYIHLSIEEKEDTTAFNSFFKKQFGQEPIYLDTVLHERSLNNIKNYLWNNGYFNGETNYTIQEKDEISSIVQYNVNPNDQHVYGNASIEFKDSTIQEDILMDIKLEEYIQKGKAYSVTDLTSLRKDLVKNALENGYYDFNINSVYVEPDTLKQERVADIHVVVDNQRDSLYNRKYYIRDIYVKFGQGIGDSYSDPIQYNNKDYSQSEVVSVSPKILDRFILFDEGEEYNRTKHLNTINKLYDLAIVKYADIEFQRIIPDSPSPSDSLFLDVFIDANARTIMDARIESTISEFEGPALGLELGYSHRNIFGGGEVFDFAVSGSLQSVNNAELENDLFGTQTLDIEPQFIFPRLLGIEKIIPNLYENTINQQTSIGARYGFQNYEELYDLQSFGFSQGWEWQSSPHNKHALSLIDVSLIDPRLDSLYQVQIQDFPTLLISFEERLILGSNYTYTYSNRQKRDENQNYFNFSGTIDLSGQLAELFGIEEVGDNEVSHYVRTLSSITFHQPIKKSNVDWVNHLQGGVAFANGGSESIPAVKQFFLGGASSLRGWRPRALGPGTFEDPTIESSNNIDQRGDIMMEFNSELRYPITKVFGLPLNGALFTDVGNIWSLREEEGERPGAEFDASELIDELAVATGTGFRLDIQNFLVIRTDFAWMVRNPVLPDGERWVDNPFALDEVQFQLGIGYPFEN